MKKCLLILVSLILSSTQLSAMEVRKATRQIPGDRFIAGSLGIATNIAVAKIAPTDNLVTLEEWRLTKPKRTYLVNRAVFGLAHAQKATSIIRSNGALAGIWLETSSGESLRCVALYYVMDKQSREIVATVCLPAAAPKLSGGRLIISAGNKIKHVDTLVADEFKLLRNELAEFLSVDLEKAKIIEKEKSKIYESRYLDILDMNFCHNCGVFFDNKSLSKCGRCLHVTYCSEYCQKQSWSTHKKTCVPANKVEKKPDVELAQTNVTVIASTEREPDKADGAVTTKDSRRRKRHVAFSGRNENINCNTNKTQLVSGEDDGSTAPQVKIEEASTNREKKLIIETAQTIVSQQEINDTIAEESPFAVNTNTHEKRKKRIRIPKIIKKAWNDTRKKPKTNGDVENDKDEAASMPEEILGIENKAVSESFWEITVTETEASVSMSEQEAGEAALEVKKVYRKLYREINKKGITYKKQIKPSKTTIIDTLLILQLQGLAEITSLDDEKISVTKTGETLLFEAHTSHASGKNKHWWENKDVRRSFLAFVAACDPLVDFYLEELFGTKK